MKHLLFQILFYLLPFFLSAQDFILKGRIIDQQSQKGVPNLVVQIVGYSQGRTDSEGVFRIAIPKKVDNVKIEVSNNYKILSHLSGNVPVPRSSDVMVEMLVQKLASENDQLQKEVARLEKQNRLKTKQIELLKSTIEDSLNVYRKRVSAKNKGTNAERDSLVQLVARLTAKLESNFLLVNKREAYQNISTDLLTYITRLKDLRDWIDHAEDVLLSEQAMNNFNKVIEKYNQARDQLFIKQADYTDQLQKYWTDETLPTDLQKICDLALKSIHDQHILTLKDTLLKSIGEFYTGKKARLVAKKEVKKQADTTTGNLLLPIRELEQEINTFNTILSKLK